MNGDPNTIAALCRIYESLRERLTQRELAMREEELWTSAKPDDVPRKVWLYRLFKEPTRIYDGRARLLHVGRAADVLWQALEARTLKMEDAVRILVDARALSTGKTELAVAVQLQLEEFWTRQPKAPPPPPVPSPKGGRRPPSREAAVRGGQRLAEIRRQQRERATEEAARKTAPVPEDTLVFRNGTRATVTELLDTFITGRQQQHEFDPYLLGKVRQDFLAWVESGITTVFSEIRKLQDHAHRDKLVKIGNTRFVDACGVLCITAQAGQRLNQKGAAAVRKLLQFGRRLSPDEAALFRKLVRTRHHERSRELHPDRRTNGSSLSENELAEYNAVQEARAVLEDYIRQVERTDHAQSSA